MKQSNRIPRRIVAALLAGLALAAAAPRSAAQPPPSGVPRLASPIPSPAAKEDQEALKAWANIGPTATNIDFRDLPLSEVVRWLLEQFRNQFDVILPTKGDDKHTTIINLQLKNVQGADVFNAMNMLFETDKTPLHWKLVLNGNRPTAVLEVLETKSGLQSPAQSSVFYISDLLPDKEGIGFAEGKLFEAISVVQNDAAKGEKPPRLAFHPDAGLLVVTGTPDQINLTQQTLSALHQKVDHDRKQAFLNEPPGQRLPSAPPGPPSGLK
ncbi:MAG: hypothetical protein ABSF38_13600 [Verrucomicrobiota bacterium]|jgi:hypothetical protein